VRMREWRWPRGGKIKFSHLQFETTVYDWQGAQITLICFDELTHFSAHQFFYMVSRNRSTCGVRPYIRGTCNPDSESWVADFLAWWIDPESGLPIPERAGVLRYFIRVAEKIEWADRPEELVRNHPRAADLPPGIEPPRPISVTFIPATVFDNPALLRVNPEYLAWLLSLPTLERERLLGGNWKIRPAAGLYFKREWCAVVDAIPADLDVVRYWDLAATEKTEFNDPDWTVGIKLGRDKDGGYWLLDMVRARANPGDVDTLLLNTAMLDGKQVRIGFGQDPGQAGKSQALHLVRALSGFTVTPTSESGDKLTRFGPFSSQCRAGNVKIRRGSWNEELFRVLEGFPELAHDDEVDACSGALEMLNPQMKGWGIYEFYRQKAEALRAETERGEATPSKNQLGPWARWNGKPSRTNRAEERRGLRRADARCPREALCARRHNRPPSIPGEPPARGTEGSNLVPSSGESRANLRRGSFGAVVTDPCLLRVLFRAGLRLCRQARTSRADQAGIGGLETPEGTADGPLRKDIPVVRAAERKVGRRQVGVRHRPIAAIMRGAVDSILSQSLADISCRRDQLGRLSAQR
jgi:predicted phage terminase large subunit-like protein